MREISTKTTYLEMRSRPDTQVEMPDDVDVLRIEKPSLDEYRAMYRSVGRELHWVDRLLMPDEKLRAILHDDLVHVHQLQVGGEPAGFSELDLRQASEIEVAYFGLYPAFIGRGLGKFFLNWTVQFAWTFQPTRVWLHTCDLDHPAALPNYRKAGFEIYDERVIQQPIPD